jgi:TfoX/Sxy family transcriptional regulator of competence genes
MGNTALEARIRRALTGLPVSEKKMFGGVCFLFNGNMLVGTGSGDLLVRVGKAGNDAALAKPHTRPMVQRGRPMAGYVYVGEEGTADARSLKAWLDYAVTHVKTLPPKAKAPPRRAKGKP